jgi:hypothetical protein
MGDGITQNVVWYVVKDCAARVGIKPLAPHDLRRTCARLCHAAGGELEQIQFLLGRASVQTTERHIGGKQDLAHAVNDRLPLQPGGPEAAHPVAIGKGIYQQENRALSSEPRFAFFGIVTPLCRAG